MATQSYTTQYNNNTILHNTMQWQHNIIQHNAMITQSYTSQYNNNTILHNTMQWQHNLTEHNAMITQLLLDHSIFTTDIDIQLINSNCIVLSALLKNMFYFLLINSAMFIDFSESQM